MATAERSYVALIGSAIARDLAIWEKIQPALKLFDLKILPEFLSSSHVTELHMTRLPPFMLEKWQVYLYTSPNEAADHTISNYFPMVVGLPHLSITSRSQKKYSSSALQASALLFP